MNVLSAEKKRRKKKQELEGKKHSFFSGLGRKRKKVYGLCRERVENHTGFSHASQFKASPSCFFFCWYCLFFAFSPYHSPVQIFSNRKQNEIEL